MTNINPEGKDAGKILGEQPIIGTITGEAGPSKDSHQLLTGLGNEEDVILFPDAKEAPTLTVNIGDTASGLNKTDTADVAGNGKTADIGAKASPPPQTKQSPVTSSVSPSGPPIPAKVPMVEQQAEQPATAPKAEPQHVILNHIVHVNMGNDNGKDKSAPKPAVEQETPKTTTKPSSGLGNIGTIAAMMILVLLVGILGTALWMKQCPTNESKGTGTVLTGPSNDAKSAIAGTNPANDAKSAQSPVDTKATVNQDGLIISTDGTITLVHAASNDGLTNLAVWSDKQSSRNVAGQTVEAANELNTRLPSSWGGTLVK